jgi:hypothetical protein
MSTGILSKTGYWATLAFFIHTVQVYELSDEGMHPKSEWIIFARIYIMI